MGSLTLTISYQKNTGLVYSASELIQLFFFGTPPRDRSGNIMPDDTLQFYIESAQKELEDSLSIKLNKTWIVESRDFLYDDWINWAYMPTTYPVVSPKSLKGYINSTLQIDYPSTWLKAKSQRPSKDLYHRSINLVPISPGSSSVSSNSLFIGLTPRMGFLGNRAVPHYWEQQYTTGWDRVPVDLLRVIGMMAAIPIFTISQDSVIGAGVQSKSIGADGLSQSVSTTSGGAFAARIKEYRTQLNDMMPRIKMHYVGITFGVLG
jgi:hypothetical protein